MCKIINIFNVDVYVTITRAIFGLTGQERCLLEMPKRRSMRLRGCWRYWD